MGQKLRIGLIYGGKSGEHEVSLQTALAVMKAFDYTSYEIKPFYITKQGNWYTADVLQAPPQEVAQLRLEAVGAKAVEGADFAAATSELPSAAPLANAGAAELSALASARQGGEGKERLDVVFPLLHGTYGEDGTVQGLLEMLNVPYVGAGVLASAVGMDKIMMKKIFAHEGLPQCVFRYFNRTQWEKDPNFFVMEIEVALGYPCFVKPANLGSSVGISKARNREQLIEAIAYALRFDRKVVVEEFVEAREIEVSVLGNDDPKASVPGEIISSGEFYDYKAKYIDGKSRMQIPADLPEDTIEAVREMALRAYTSLDCAGLSRVDFFLRKQDNQLLINEINTMPGFTPYSMYPLMWKESGVSYPQLLDTLIQLAISRHEQKQRIDYSGGEEA